MTHTSLIFAVNTAWWLATSDAFLFKCSSMRLHIFFMWSSCKRFDMSASQLIGVLTAPLITGKNCGMLCKSFNEMLPLMKNWLLPQVISRFTCKRCRSVSISSLAFLLASRTTTMSCAKLFAFGKTVRLDTPALRLYRLEPAVILLRILGESVMELHGQLVWLFSKAIERNDLLLFKRTTDWLIRIWYIWQVGIRANTYRWWNWSWIWARFTIRRR